MLTGEIHNYNGYILTICSTIARAYRAAEGGERACNSRTSCIEGEMLAVTKFKSRNDAV